MVNNWMKPCAYCTKQLFLVFQFTIDTWSTVQSPPGKKTTNKP